MVKTITSWAFITLILTVGCKSNEQINQGNQSTTTTIETPKEADKILSKTPISGLITDASGEPLIGANVLIVSTSEGTVTDIDGRFVMSSRAILPLDIQVSFTGYESQLVNVTDPSMSLEIKLVGAEMLEEVVVDGATGHAESKGKISKSSTIIVSDAMMSAPAPRAAMSRSRSDMSKPSTGPIKTPSGEVVDPKAGQITAAEWNDLYNWEDWNELLNNQDYNEMQSHWQIFPRTRYSVFVKNKYELPIQDARVELLDQTGHILWSAHTDNAGRAELWADINSREKSFKTVDARVIINSKSHLIKDLKTVDLGANHLDVDAECRTSPNVDILFAVDATGSMGDEINFLQSELKDVINRAMASNSNLKIRMGSVFYRDSSDTYLTQVQPFTDKPEETLSFIATQKANGGGDYPEAVDAALEQALAQDWSEDAVTRIIFLLLDAPPHHNPETIARIQQQVADAAKEGIKIIPITASGINRQTEFLMKFMAIATNGTYVFITDHSGIGNPHLDPVVQDYEVEKLNDLLVRLLYNYTKSNGCNANEPLNNGITFYPNPARHFVNIQTEKPIRTLKVLSNSGMLIHTKTDVAVGETRIDLTSLVDGVYTVQCTGDGVDFSQSVVVVNR